MQQEICKEIDEIRFHLNFRAALYLVYQHGCRQSTTYAARSSEFPRNVYQLPMMLRGKTCLLERILKDSHKTPRSSTAAHKSWGWVQVN
eukprot:15232062-Ditylum_brightwellii.AAC.1